MLCKTYGISLYLFLDDDLLHELYTVIRELLDNWWQLLEPASSAWNVGCHAGIHAGWIEVDQTVKVRLHRPQHDDVIARIVSLGIRRRPRRGSRGGHRRIKASSINSTAGNSATSQPESRVDATCSTAHDQLITPLMSNVQVNRWKLPTFLLTNVRSLTNKMDDFEAVVRLNNPDVVCVTETYLPPAES